MMHIDIQAVDGEIFSFELPAYTIIEWLSIEDDQCHIILQIPINLKSATDNPKPDKQFIYTPQIN